MNQQKRYRRHSFSWKPYFCKNRTALSICIQVVLLLLSSNGKWIENGETNHVKNFHGSCGKPPTKFLQPSLGELHGFGSFEAIYKGQKVAEFYSLRRAAQGCVIEKQGVVKSYLVFSMKTWTQRSQFLHSHTDFPEAQLSSQFPILHGKWEMKQNRLFFKATTNVKLLSSYQILASSAKRDLKPQLHWLAQIGDGSFVSLPFYPNRWCLTPSQPL